MWGFKRRSKATSEQSLAIADITDPYLEQADHLNAAIVKAIETGEPQWMGVWGPTQQLIYIEVRDGP